jgi:hypothetical protein
MTTEEHRSFRPLNVQAHSNSGAWLPNQKWLAQPTNASFIEDQIAPGFKPKAKYDLAFFGGTTIADLVVQCFFVDPHNTWTAAEKSATEQALSAAMSDSNLNSIVGQYFQTPISSKVLASTTLNAATMTTCHQNDIEHVVTTLHDNKTLQGDFTSTAFCFLLPQGVRLLDAQGDDSYNGLGGYHGSVVCGADTIYYAAGVYSDTAESIVNGIPFFKDPWKNVVATFYHELNELRTDADVELSNATGKMKNVLGWYSSHYGEIGDIPMHEAGQHLDKVMKEVPLANGQGTVPVQLMYSNRDHGPAAVVESQDVV